MNDTIVKSCGDCKHKQNNFGVMNCKVNDTYCTVEREYGTICGPQGKCWEQKMKKKINILPWVFLTLLVSFVFFMLSV